MKYRGTKTAASVLVSVAIMSVLVYFCVLQGITYVMVGDIINQVNDQSTDFNVNGDGVVTMGWLLLVGGIIGILIVGFGEYKFLRFLYR